MTVLTPAAVQFDITSRVDFRTWAGTDAPVLAGTDIHDADWHLPQTRVLRAYHGTTHAFTRFDLSRGNHEGFLGKVHYFTSCSRDAQINYASEDGPDLLARIERLAEQLDWDIENDLAAAGLPEDASQDAIADKAEEIARSRLLGDAPHVKEVYLRVDRPFIINAARPILFLPEAEDSFHTALCQVAEEEGLNPDHLAEDPEEFEDRIHELADEIDDVCLERVQNAFAAACAEIEGIDSNLALALPGNPFEITMCDVSRHFRESEDLIFADDLEGNHVNGTLLSMMLKELGYDSVILRGADRFFNTMSMTPATAHIHILPGFESRIKSATQCAAFDPTSKDIHA